MKLRFTLLAFYLISFTWPGLHAQKSYTTPEERGENLSLLPTDDLLKRLEKVDMAGICAGVPHMNEGCIELRKICWALGDRHLDGSFKPNKKEKALLYRLTEAYLAYFKQNKEHGFEEAYSQLVQLWGLAVPALMDYADSDDPDMSQFTIQLLLDMRDEAIIQFFVEKALHETNWRKRGLWLQMLGFIRDSQEIYLSCDNRKPMDVETNRRLYERHVKAAHLKLLAEYEHPVFQRPPCPEEVDGGVAPQNLPTPEEMKAIMDSIQRDTLHSIKSQLANVQRVFDASRQLAPSLGKTTLTVGPNYVMTIREEQGQAIIVTECSLLHLRADGEGIRLVLPTEKKPSAGVQFEMQPSTSLVRRFRDGKMVEENGLLEVHLADLQHVQWFIQELFQVLISAQKLY